MIGFIAVDQYGTTHKLTVPFYPRKQLLEILGVKSARKMYRDIAGKSQHVGYIIGPSWYEILEVHVWNGGVE